MSESIAKEGYVYVCHACGKTSKGKYGTEGMRGWDESCMMNCEEYSITSLVYGTNGRVTQIKDEELTL